MPRVHRRKYATAREFRLNSWIERPSINRSHSVTGDFLLISIDVKYIVMTLYSWLYVCLVSTSAVFHGFWNC